MTIAAAIQIHPWAQAFVHVIDFCEFPEAGAEELDLVPGQAADFSPRSSCAATHTGIPGNRIERGDRCRENEETDGHQHE
jgi:hypothetical protein